MGIFIILTPVEHKILLEELDGGKKIWNNLFFYDKIKIVYCRLIMIMFSRR